MAIHETAEFRVRPAALPRCRRAIRAFVGSVGRHEPGTTLDVSLQGTRDRRR